MKDTKEKRIVTFSEIRRMLKQRRRQLVFDEYPEHIKDVLTRMGLNPYEEDADEKIEYSVLKS